MAFPRAPTSSSSSHEHSSRSRKRPPRRRPATHAHQAKAPSTVQKMPALVAASSRIVAPAQLKARAAPARRVVAVHAVASAKCVIRSLHIRASRGVPARVDALAARLGPRPTPRCRLSTSRRGSAIVVQTAGAPSLTPSPRPHRRHTEGEARFPLKTVAVAGASPPLSSAVPSLPRPTREPTNKTTDCRRMMMHLCARRSANGPLRSPSTSALVRPIRVPSAGLAALQLAGAAAPAFAGDVFDDRAAQKAALLAAARAKAAAQAQAQAPPPAPIDASSFVAKDDFKDQDVRMQGVRETGADETYVASTYDPNEASAVAPEPAAAPLAEPEPEPANVTEGGGLFGMFAGGGAP